MTRRDAPATSRNREPILSVLERWLVEPSRVLELASGTGQHAVFFAARMPGVTWLPSDADSEALESIRSWVDEAALPNLDQPRILDATSIDWGVGTVDAVFNANMIHISDWSVALGLLAGAGRVLAAKGIMFLYGPFRVSGKHTSQSNADFDASLRARNSGWGIRDLEAVVEAAEKEGLLLVETNDLPANNKLLVFERS